MKLFGWLFLIVISGMSVVVEGAEGKGGTSYGICAHVSREFADFPMAGDECELIAKAGLNWARTDFDWSAVEKSEGVWDFSLFDKTIDIAESKGVTILPILGYSVKWAHPAYKHKDKWLEYVRRTVGRYKGRLKCWEVWNEPDGAGFWGDRPDASQYALLLKDTYLEIKKIDPELTVLLGGLSGLPLDYIETIYETIGCDYFDVMVVHPYRYPNSPEQGRLYYDLYELRKLMAKYGDYSKPVWITEIGWPTHETKAFAVAEIIRAGLKSLGMNDKNIRLAVMDEPGYIAGQVIMGEQLKEAFQTSGKLIIDRMSLSEACGITAKDHDVILLPGEEAIAPELFETVEKFVRDGGCAIFTKGVPLYYKTVKDSNGRWKHMGMGNEYRDRLHIGWEAWWTRGGVPQEVKKLTANAEYADIISLENYTEASRFLTDSKLKGGDKFLPLVMAGDGGYKGAAAAVIDYDSDLKGSVIISSFFTDNRGVTPAVQGEYLPRVFNLCFQARVDKVFWYNLRASERDKYYNEDNFGIVHADLSAKPAYIAACTLTDARPEGSERISGKWREGELYYPSWRRPDGKLGYALWSSGGEKTVVVENIEAVVEAYEYLGNEVELGVKDGKCELKASGKTLYLIAEESLRF